MPQFKKRQTAVIVVILNLLAAVFFNSIWIIGAFAFGWLLTQTFRLVDLPHWLEWGVTIALSFWVGLLGMAMFAQRLSGESWKDCRRFVGLMFICALPTIWTCVLAIVSYLTIHLLRWDVEIEKYAVYGICAVFWFVTMHLTTQKWERKAKE